VKELVVYLARALAGRPEEVAARESGGENGALTLELTVADEDLNQIIGKQGRTIKAMRTLLAAAAAKKGRRAFLKIREGGEPLRPEPGSDGPEEAPRADGRPGGARV
jgi:Predicted RNA-binding protein (contains KH domain)